MSLRAQIHDAIDDIAPPVPTLETRVRAFVRADNQTRARLRARPQSLAYRWRGTFALVAAALVVILIGGLVLVGRYWRNENLPPQTIGQNELKSLENRPLNIPTIAPGSACPSTPVYLNSQIGMVVGDGPVYLYNTDVYQRNDWGLWIALAFTANFQDKPGLILIRARDLKGAAQVAFAKYPLAPTPVTAVGPVIGRSNVANHDVQMRSEAAIPAPTTWPPKSNSHLELIALIGLQKGGSGCIGFQIDGSGFTENFVVRPGVPG